MKIRFFYFLSALLCSALLVSCNSSKELTCPDFKQENQKYAVSSKSAKKKTHKSNQRKNIVHRQNKSNKQLSENAIKQNKKIVESLTPNDQPIENKKKNGVISNLKLPKKKTNKIASKLNLSQEKTNKIIPGFGMDEKAVIKSNLKKHRIPLLFNSPIKKHLEKQKRIKKNEKTNKRGLNDFIKSNNLSVLSLVFGGLGLLILSPFENLFLFILGISMCIAGVVLGIIALRRRQNPIAILGLAFGEIGLILGILFLYVVFIIF